MKIQYDSPKLGACGGGRGRDGDGRSPRAPQRDGGRRVDARRGGNAGFQQLVLDGADPASNVEQRGALDAHSLRCLDQCPGRGNRAFLAVLAQLRGREFLAVEAPHPTRGRGHYASPAGQSSLTAPCQYPEKYDLYLGATHLVLGPEWESTACHQNGAPA